MKPLCKSCDISGEEERISKIRTGMTLEECKLECMDDPICSGIDFGKDNRRGECYINYEEDVSFENHNKFDAWSKNPDCGTLLHYNYRLQKFLLFIVINETKPILIQLMFL